jgi:hypothetical protein
VAVALRAKRRAGELLAASEKNRGTVLGGNAVLPPDPTPKLADLGVSKGELLAATEKQAGARTPTGLQAVTPKLADLGVSKIDSSRWQAAIMAAWRP